MIKNLINVLLKITFIRNILKIISLEKYLRAPFSVPLSNSIFFTPYLNHGRQGIFHKIISLKPNEIIAITPNQISSQKNTKRKRSQSNDSPESDSKKRKEKKWTKENLKELWVGADEELIKSLSENTIDKVNAVSQYLRKDGLRLSGVKSGKNSLYHSFLGSYKNYKNTQSIPDLDAKKSNDEKIKFLRTKIAHPLHEKDSAQTDKNQENEIKGSVEDFKKLSKYTQIPIRVITPVGTNSDGCTDFLFDTNGNKKDLKTSNNNAKLPEHYMCIIDLDGHFVYASKISLEVPAKAPSTKSVYKELKSDEDVEEFVDSLKSKVEYNGKINKENLKSIENLDEEATIDNIWDKLVELEIIDNDGNIDKSIHSKNNRIKLNFSDALKEYEKNVITILKVLNTSRLIVPSIVIHSSISIENLCKRIERLSSVATFSSVKLKLDEEHIKNFKNFWKIHYTSKPIPPLPNIEIQLPSGMNLGSLKGSSGMLEAADKKYTPGWITRDGKSLPRVELSKRESTTDSKYFICYGSGKLVNNIRDLDTEHVFPKKSIKSEDTSITSRIFELINAMNDKSTKECSERVQKIFGKFSDRYIKKNDNGEFFPTKLFLRDYFNDMKNLFFMRKIDNEDKSTDNPMSYFDKNPYYDGFLTKDTLCEDYITYRVKNDNNTIYGLGEAAVRWYHEKHKWLIEITKIDFNITEILNEKAKKYFEEKREIDKLPEGFEKDLALQKLQRKNPISLRKRHFIKLVAEDNTPGTSDDSQDTGSEGSQSPPPLNKESLLASIRKLVKKKNA